MPKLNVRLDADTTIDVEYNDTNTIVVDRCDFVVRKGSMKRSDEGYLKGDAAIAKVGILSYLLPNGTIRKELVPSETLFNKDSMATLVLQPITDRHPAEVLLNKTTVKRRKVGMTGENNRRDEDYLVTSLAITDEDAIVNVETGRQQLSPGYKCSLVLQEGIYKGERFDAVQIGRKYNHVAICDRARGGSDLKLNLDSVDVEHLDGFEYKEDGGMDCINKGKELSMPKFKIGGIDYEAAQEVINHITSLDANIDSLKKEVKTANDSVTAAQAKLDEATEKVDSLEKRDIQKEISDGVAGRLSLLKVANDVLEKDIKEDKIKIDDMSDLDVRKAVILNRSPNAKLDDKDEVYINARFDAVVEGLDFDPDAASNNRKKSGNRMDNDTTDPVDKAKNDSEERITKAYENIPDQYK